jgi:effector-binding domain-containing protein
MPPTVDVQSVTSVPLSVVRRRARQSAFSTVVPQACGVVWNAIRDQKAPGAGRLVAVYLGAPVAGEFDIEVGVEMPTPLVHGEVVASSTPAGRVAHAAHVGPYHRLGEAHKALCDYCSTHGLALAGPSWEVYGHWTDDESKLRTDVFYLLAKA